MKLKDKGGDPYCPINGKLDGIFFCANSSNGLDKKRRRSVPGQGELPEDSHFGDTRWKVTPDTVCNELQSPNVYFADFYCMNTKARVYKKTHYVTLALTNSGTKADDFCGQNLLKLDLRKNPFFHYMKPAIKDGKMFRVSGRTWVEIFYTEKLDLRLGEFVEHKFARGSSSELPKDKNCTVCNPPIATSM